MRHAGPFKSSGRALARPLPALFPAPVTRVPQRARARVRRERERERERERDSWIRKERANEARVSWNIPETSEMPPAKKHHAIRHHHISSRPWSVIANQQGSPVAFGGIRQLCNHSRVHDRNTWRPSILYQYAKSPKFPESPEDWPVLLFVPWR